MTPLPLLNHNNTYNTRCLSCTACSYQYRVPYQHRRSHCSILSDRPLQTHQMQVVECLGMIRCAGMVVGDLHYSLEMGEFPVSCRGDCCEVGVLAHSLAQFGHSLAARVGRRGGEGGRVELEQAKEHPRVKRQDACRCPRVKLHAGALE